MTVEPLAPIPAGVDAEKWRAACEQIRSYCGWHIAPSITETVRVDGSGGDTQLLPTLHLTDLTGVKSDGRAVLDPEWSEMGMIRGSWTSKFRGVEATMTHGFESCPVEILPIVIAVMSGESGIVKAVTSGPHSVTYADAAIVDGGKTSAQVATLNRYRL